MAPTTDPSQPPASGVPAHMHLTIATVNEEVFEGDVRYVEVPGEGGRFAVLPGHTPVMALLAPGKVHVHPVAGEPIWLAVLGGMAEVDGHSVTILADHVGRDAEAESARMEAARRSASVHVPFAERPIGAAAMRDELNTELLRFFAQVVAQRRG